MNWRPNTRAPIIPLPGSVNYVQALRVMRTQCEVVFGLPLAAVRINTEAEQPSRRQAKKKCPLSVYGRHFKDTMKDAGAPPTRTDDTDWAKASQYSVKSVLKRRGEFKATLPVDKRENLFRRGPADELGGKSGQLFFSAEIARSCRPRFNFCSRSHYAAQACLEVTTVEIRRAEEITPAFEAIEGRADALYGPTEESIFCTVADKRVFRTLVPRGT
jgi:hypothetical protein